MFLSEEMKVVMKMMMMTKKTKEEELSEVMKTLIDSCVVQNPPERMTSFTPSHFLSINESINNQSSTSSGSQL